MAVNHKKYLYYIFPNMMLHIFPWIHDYSLDKIDDAGNAFPSVLKSQHGKVKKRSV